MLFSPYFLEYKNKIKRFFCSVQLISEYKEFQLYNSFGSELFCWYLHFLCRGYDFLFFYMWRLSKKNIRSPLAKIYKYFGGPEFKKYYLCFYH